jgi:subtilisin family serine protease
MDAAVDRAVADGIVVVVAAGNSNADACRSSPARAAAAITVGATTSSDSRASYSNYGTCLDLFAPGSDITSAWWENDSQTARISGTSMASPHVAGVAALFLAANTNASPAEVDAAIKSAATTGVVGSAGRGSPNRLLYSLFGAAPPPPSDNIVLLVRVASNKRSKTANLSWTGANGAVDVFDGATKLITTTNTSYKHSLSGTGTKTYKVCLAGTSTCSDSVTVSY